MTPVLGIAAGFLVASTGMAVANAIREPLSQPERILMAALACAGLGLIIAVGLLA